MYCSRRGREVSRPTDTCTRCGRCNWEKAQDRSKIRKSSLVTILLIGAVILLAAALIR